MSKAYEVITEKLIELIETSGQLPWQCPWLKVDGQANHISGKAYKGINAVMTSLYKQVRGFNSNHWITFNQAKEKGWSIKKGSKGIPIIFYALLKKVGEEEVEIEEEKTKLTKYSTIPLAKYSTVFNLDQVDGDIPKSETETRDNLIDLSNYQSILSNLNDLCPINFDGGNRAYYSPIKDSIHLPLQNQFTSIEGFYSTVFHEITHATGHETRLKRDMKNVFGSHEYSFEELIAELGSAFLLNKFNIPIEEKNTAGYLQNWLKVLKGNKKWIIEASSKATKAVEYLTVKKG